MQSLDRHNASKMHANRTAVGVKKYTCGCGKFYLHQHSVRNHKLKCSFIEVSPPNPAIIVPPVIADVITAEQIIIELKQAFEKERQEMKIAFEESMKEQINKILDKHAGTAAAAAAGTTNHTNSHNNIETQQNITININAFGNENTDYIDEKAILSCIGLVYKSIPSLLEKIHFDPKHPENHNIKITNKKLPYASVMGNNQKWKTVDRKDAIETMVQNGYNMLDEKYVENKDKLLPAKQQKFEGFLSKLETEDKDVMRQIKSEVDMMVLNGGN
jgi:hypothetical protein